MSWTFERLEDRLLLAAGIVVKGTMLIVTFDGGGDPDVVLTGTAEGAITVTGTDDDGSFTGIRNIKIVGHAGSDHITLDKLLLRGNITADLRGGDDVFTMTGETIIGGNISIKTGDGADTVRIDADVAGKQITLLKNVTVDLGSAAAGIDTFTIFGDQLDDEVREITGIGGNLTVKGQGGSQQVSFDTLLLTKNLKIDLGAGNDSIRLAVDANEADVGVLVGGNATLKLGDGDDAVTFIGGGEGAVTFNRNLTIDLGNDDGDDGNGGDTVEMTSTSDPEDGIALLGNVVIKGKGGAQELHFDGVAASRNVTINLGDGNDSIDVNQLAGEIAGTVGGNLNINLGNGDDQINVERLTVTKGVKINGGNGEDTGEVTAGAAVTVGGKASAVSLELGDLAALLNA